MPRGLTAQNKADLEAAHDCVGLLYIGHSTPIYLTTAMRDVVSGGNTFLAAAHILEIGDIEESSDLRVGTLSITFSAVDQTYVSLFFNNSMNGTPLRFWRGYIKQDWTVAFAVSVFDGAITQPALEDNGGAGGSGESKVIVRAAGEFANFPAKNGRLTNDRSQQIHFPGDTGLRHAAEVDRNILWGRKP